MKNGFALVGGLVVIAFLVLGGGILYIYESAPFKFLKSDSDQELSRTPIADRGREAAPPPVTAGPVSQPQVEKKAPPAKTSTYNVGVFLFKYPDTILPEVLYCLWPTGSRTLAFGDCSDLNFGEGKALERHPLLDLLTDPVNRKRAYEFDNFYSLYYFADYFREKASAYGVDAHVSLKLEGVFDLAEPLPKLPEVDARVGESLPKLNAELADYRFFRKAVEKKIDLSQFDQLVYIFLSDWGLQKRDETFDFGSVALPSSSEAVINIIIGSDLFRGRHIAVLDHEFQHLLGARDLYYPLSCPYGAKQTCCELPDGIPDPEKVPRFPQVRACSMCPMLIKSESGVSVTSNLEETVICSTTAREMGWIK